METYIINSLILGLRRECDLQCPPRQQEKLGTNLTRTLAPELTDLKPNIPKRVTVHTFKKMR